MGAVGGVGPAGVTLQIAIARRARGVCATLRELNHALRRRQTAAPWFGVRLLYFLWARPDGGFAFVSR
jgi:hypothetical protein